MKVLTRLPTGTSQAWQRMVLCLIANQLVNTLTTHVLVCGAGMRSPSRSRRLECPLRRSNTHCGALSLSRNYA
jgi:hypothetical protein